ncbi:hypothetical protein QJQ45_025969 [Haematococcus lacustris]|nr:hypothetical protein QJQ45_025969 [Haematococcus lacustris]
MAARHRAWWPNIDGEQHILNDAGEQADLVQELEALLLPTCPTTTSVAMTAPSSPVVATVSEPIQLTAVMAPQPAATVPDACQAVEAAQMREPEEWSWQQQYIHSLVVLLTEPSQQLLLALMPALHPHTHASMALPQLPSWEQQPSMRQLLQLPLGSVVELEVVGVAVDSGVQGVAVTVAGDMLPLLINTQCADLAALHAGKPLLFIPISTADGYSVGHAGHLVHGGVQGTNSCYHAMSEGLPLVGLLAVKLLDGVTCVTSCMDLHACGLMALPKDLPPVEGTPPVAWTDTAETADQALCGLVDQSEGTGEHHDTQPPVAASEPSFSTVDDQQQQVPQDEALQPEAALWGDLQGHGQPGRAEVQLSMPTPSTTTQHAGATPGSSRASAASSCAPSCEPSPAPSPKAPPPAAMGVQTLSNTEADAEFELWLQQDERLAHEEDLRAVAAGKQAAALPSAALLGNLASKPVAAPPGAGVVQWVSEVAVGDLAEVLPLAVATASTNSAGSSGDDINTCVQGVVDELVVDDMFQPQGVLVRLEDNTLGHVRRVVNPQHRQNQQAWPTLGLPSPAARPAGTQKATPASLTAPLGQKEPAAVAPAAGRSDSKAVGGIKVIRAAGLATKDGAVPKVKAKQGKGVGGKGRGSKLGQPAEEEDAAAQLALWQSMQRVYGESITHAILEDCGGCLSRAIAVLQDVDNLPDLLTSIVNRSIERLEAANAAAAAAAAAEEERARQERAAQAAARRNASGMGARPGTNITFTRPGSSGRPQGLGGLKDDPASFPSLGPANGHAAPPKEGTPFQGTFCPIRGAGNAPPKLKLLRNTDSLASLAGNAGLNLKDAEALKQLFPAVDNRTLVQHLLLASGDVTGAIESLLVAGAPSGPSSDPGTGSGAGAGDPSVGYLAAQPAHSSRSSSPLHTPSSHQDAAPSYPSRLQTSALPAAPGLGEPRHRVAAEEPGRVEGGAAPPQPTSPSPQGLQLTPIKPHAAWLQAAAARRNANREDKLRMLNASQALPAKAAYLRDLFEGLDVDMATFALSAGNGDLQAAITFLTDSLSAHNSVTAARDAQSADAARLAALANPGYAAAAAVRLGGGSDEDSSGSGSIKVLRSRPRSSTALSGLASAPPAAPRQALASAGGSVQGMAAVSAGAKAAEWQTVPSPSAAAAAAAQPASGPQQPFDVPAAKLKRRLETDKARNIAQIYYDARNLFFQQAAQARAHATPPHCMAVPPPLHAVPTLHPSLQAYDAGDGKSAALFSRKGREFGELARKYRQVVNDQAYKASNLGIRNSFTMDLHGMHVDEALDLVGRQLDALSRLVFPEGVLLKIITGRGAHSVGNVAQIRAAVMAELKASKFRHFVEPGNEGVETAMEASLQKRVYDAAATGDAETLEGLLRSSAELGKPRLLEWRDKEGRTPLIIAALKNHEQCVEMLLANKADVTCQGEDGTALHYAICKGSCHTSIIKLLLANAANPFVQNAIERTPVDEAMAEHMYDIVDIIRQMAPWSGIVDVKVHIVGGWKEEEEEEEEEEELTKSLVVLEPIFYPCSDIGGHYQATAAQMVQLVAYKDERDMVGRRLELGWDSWKWEQTSYDKLHVENCRTKFSLRFDGPSPSDNRDVLAAVLKSIKVACNVQGQVKVSAENDEYVGIHIHYGKLPDAAGLGVLLHSLPVAQYVGEWQAIDNAVLFAYIEEDNKRCADMFLRNGADVHSWGYMESGTHGTALHMAAEGTALGRDMSCVELLLDHGASPFIGNAEGRTPLDCFVYPRVNKGDEEEEDICLPQVAKDGVPGYLTRCMAVVPHFESEHTYFEPAGKKVQHDNMTAWLYIYKEGPEGELLFGQWGTGSVCTGDGAKCLWTENMTLHEDTAHKSLCEGCAAQRATAASTACPVCCKPVLQVLAKLP